MSLASMLQCSAVDVFYPPMHSFITQVIAYACKVQDGLFLPLLTQAESSAAGMSTDPAFLVDIVQSCLSDGTLRVFGCYFVHSRVGQQAPYPSAKI
jgi:hypothetical protein